MVVFKRQAVCVQVDVYKHELRATSMINMGKLKTVDIWHMGYINNGAWIG
jgi:hypothetical protein